MKIVAVNGSPKNKGNTAQVLLYLANQFGQQEIELEIIQVGNHKIRGCLACGKCKENQDEKCVIKGDQVNNWIQKMKQAAGIILASPVHYAGISGTMKSFLDRAFYVSSANGNLYRHKVGSSLVVVRRAGGLPAFNQLNNYLNYSEMLLPGSNYWNIIYGTAPGDISQDEEGKQILRVLAKNMSWALKLVEAGENKVERPQQEDKTFLNFIR